MNKRRISTLLLLSHMLCILLGYYIAIVNPRDIEGEMTRETSTDTLITEIRETEENVVIEEQEIEQTEKQQVTETVDETKMEETTEMLPSYMQPPTTDHSDTQPSSVSTIPEEPPLHDGKLDEDEGSAMPV